MRRTRARSIGDPVTTAACFGLGLVLSSAAEAQSEQPNDPPPADLAPPETQPPKEPLPSVPAESAPAEFPGEMQSGGVAAPSPPSARPWPTQRNFAITATWGSSHGIGLGVRAGWPRVGVDASFGFFPILATFSSDPQKFPEFELLLSYQANGSIYIGLYRPDPRTDLGIAFGYKYNSLLQHGATVSFYIQRELSAHWTLQGFAGPAIFPDAEDQVRKETGWVGGSVLSGMAWHQAGLGVSLAFFP